MADIRFDDVLKLAEQLPEDEQNRLIYRLRLKQRAQKPLPPVSADAEPVHNRWYAQRGSEDVDNPTREELLRDVEALRSTPPRAQDRLLGKYANPSVTDVSAEEFHAQMHALATEWEQELDEFNADQS